MKNHPRPCSSWKEPSPPHWKVGMIQIQKTTLSIRQLIPQNFDPTPPPLFYNKKTHETDATLLKPSTDPRPHI
jgi:hypothetical protein